MSFVDEGDDRRGARLDLADDVFEPILELALDARTGLQQAEIQAQQFDAFERGRHVALHDPQGEPLHDGCLAGARLADQDRVVLAPAAENVDHLADFGVPGEDRINLAGSGLGGEIDGVLIEGVALLPPRGRRRLLLAGSLAPAATNDLIEVVAQLTGVDPLQLRGVFADAGVVGIERVRQDDHARADMLDPRVLAEHQGRL